MTLKTLGNLESCRAAMASSAPDLLILDMNLSEDRAIDLLKVLGQALGCQCEQPSATSGSKAIHALKTASYDLVFMDCQMPELDGYGATAQLRDPATGVKNRSVPVVALTANAMPSDREKCLQAGMSRESSARHQGYLQNDR